MTINHKEEMQKSLKQKEVESFNGQDGELGEDQAHLIKEVVPEKKTHIRGSDHLLILAHSAALVLGSKDGFNRPSKDDLGCDGLPIAPAAQNLLGNASPDIETDENALRKQSCGMAVIDGMTKEVDGLKCEVRTPRLSQLRRLARSTSNILGQGGSGEGTGGYFQGRRIRLTEVRHRARSKSHGQLRDQGENNSCLAARGRITRLSQLRHQARCRGDFLVEEAIKNVRSRPLNCQTSERVQSLQKYLVKNKVSRWANGLSIISVNGEAEENISSNKGRKRLNHLRREARQSKARKGYAPSGFLLAMIRRC